MHISNLKLWNFRKFGSAAISEGSGIRKPDLDLNFKSGLNVLIGENDSGKTAIIDAIKLVLRTHSYEWIQVDAKKDFHVDASEFRIEIKFKGLEDNEAKNFTEWLGWTGEGSNAKPYLRLIYKVSKKGDSIQPTEVTAGVDEEGYRLTPGAREYLKATYLKPLRDADTELIAKKNSRLSQILIGHEVFKEKDKGEKHDLVDLFSEFNKAIEEYFKGNRIMVDIDNQTLQKVSDKESEKAKLIKEGIDIYIKQFFQKISEAKIGVSPGSLKEILEKLSLELAENHNPGLGTMNRLFMAAELLHLQRTDWSGLKLGLIEELEAHLHPQVQMKVIEALQKEKDVQLILTTHSPNLASKVKLDSLIICNGNNAFPMGKEYSNLPETYYLFLERFLDVTKSNLFFAKGVLLVEGWSEEILLPALARKLKRIGVLKNDLTEAEVSVVNVQSTAMLKYAKVFSRKDDEKMSTSVAVICDCDIKPKEELSNSKFIKELKGFLKAKKKKMGQRYNEDDAKKLFEKKNRIETQFTVATENELKRSLYNQGRIKGFVNELWTLEYCMARSVFKRHLFIATRKAALDMERDGYKSKWIKENWRSFSNGKPEEQIAYEFYSKFVVDGKKISKAIISQYLARLIDVENNITKETIEGDEYLKYLVDAIKHACSHD